MSSLVVAYFFGVNFLLVFCFNYEGGDNKLENLEDNFASPGNLTLWAAIEYEIYTNFKSYYNRGSYDKEPSISKSVLEKYFYDYEDSIGLNRSDSDFNNIFSVAKEISSNPIMVYRMLSRIHKYKKFLEIFGSKTNEVFEGKEANLWELLRINEKSIPTQSDIQEAMESILRLHYIYDLNLTDFTSGLIGGIKTNARLNAIHCYEIGIFASKIGYYDLSIEWLETAFSKVYFESDTSVDRNTIRPTLLELIMAHDAALKDIPKWVPTVYSDSLWDKYHEPGKYPNTNNRTKRKTVLYGTWKGRRESNFNDLNFCLLCSGKSYQTEKEKAQLYCWLDSGKSKINLLSPSKMELLSKYPYIVQIYDAIGLKLSDRISMKAENNLKRSEVLNNKVKGTKLSKVRTSVNAWLFTTEDTKDLIKVEKRIESITGLKMDDDASEALQFASYVFGRHYDVHTDTLTDPELTGHFGDRIATFMIYLDEPLAGGYTAFTQAGIAAKPVKGSAVFWYNLYRNGSAMDDITWHGACPVLLGHKSVGNKWIRFRPQLFAAPCSLDQNDTVVSI